MAKVGLGAGLGLIGVGVGMKAGALGHGGETDPEDVAFIPITGGVIFALVSTFILLGTEDDKPAEASVPKAAPPTDPEAEGRAPDQRSAQQLETQAKATAHAGDCRTALRLAEQVRAMNAERHAALVRDAGIARCLQSP